MMLVEILAIERKVGATGPDPDRRSAAMVRSLLSETAIQVVS
jgi:hypothetical protein